MVVGRKTSIFDASINPNSTTIEREKIKTVKNLNTSLPLNTQKKIVYLKSSNVSFYISIFVILVAVRKKDQM